MTSARHRVGLVVQAVNGHRVIGDACTWITTTGIDAEPKGRPL